jgi:Tfp pilus assembly protein PilN
MKNRVNLYHPQFHPKLRLLSLSISLMLWAFVLIICLITYFYLLYQYQQTQSEVVKIEQNKQQQVLLTSELQFALDNLKVDANLVKQVELNQHILGHKNRVLKEISGQEQLKSNGFSRLMADLAKHHQAGLWLTHINLDGANVMVEGAANESSIIPKWVNSLGQTAYFKGQEFADTRLYRDTNQQLNFVITTGKETTAQEALTNE